MKITITYKEDASNGTHKVEEIMSNRVTFPPELPYVIIGAWPKVAGKTRSIFLPDIFTMEMSD